MTMHRYCYYTVCMRSSALRTYRVYMRVYMRTALYVCVICTLTTIMYTYNIMYAHNNNVCVKRSACSHAYAYKHKCTRAHALPIVSKKRIAPP